MKMTGTVTVIRLIFLESLSHSSPSQGHSREHLCTVSLSNVISSITLFPLSSIIENSLTATKKHLRSLTQHNFLQEENRLSVSLRFVSPQKQLTTRPYTCTMKTHHPKLKTQPRPLFSCSFFRQCTETTLSPTTPNPPALPISSTIPTPAPPPQTAAAPTPAPPPPQQQLPNQPHQKSTQAESSSSSSSTTTSQSFTQWRFPLSNSPLHQPRPESQPNQDSAFIPPLAPPMHPNDLQELLRLAELQLTNGSETEQLSALYLLERSLVPDPPSDPVCSLELMRGVVANLKNKAGVKPATKVLLALCLAEANRHVAVEAWAVGTVVEVAMELDGAPAERALAALELTCTVAEGAAELRNHALAVPVMVTMMGKMAGRGKEYAISALAVIYGGGGVESDGEQTLHAPPEEVARAVALALQGDCTARGRRKGAQLLKALQEYGRVDSTQEGNEQP